nr:RNA-directed DNA polymerase, eukaryota, reverse transcriptase zinc-binding domain protein [Tanacetum cinerariifolium]
MVKDFRLISLIGSLYKVIAKILTNCLVNVTGDLVNEVQSAFVAERQILDGPFILNEVGENMSRKEAWKEVVDKLLSHLSKWKTKTLSIGGRFTLLKSVLRSMSVFHMSILKIPSVIKAIQGDDGKLDKYVIVGGQTCWTLIVKEARSLKGMGINVVDLIHLKLGNGDSSSFWEEKWRVRSGAEESQFNSLLEIVQVINLVPCED